MVFLLKTVGFGVFSGDKDDHVNEWIVKIMIKQNKRASLFDSGKKWTRYKAMFALEGQFFHHIPFLKCAASFDALTRWRTT